LFFVSRKDRGGATAAKKIYLMVISAIFAPLRALRETVFIWYST
jgi:hypothetical protein